MPSVFTPWIFFDITDINFNLPNLTLLWMTFDIVRKTKDTIWFDDINLKALLCIILKQIDTLLLYMKLYCCWILSAAHFEFKGILRIMYTWCCLNMLILLYKSHWNSKYFHFFMQSTYYCFLYKEHINVSMQGLLNIFSLHSNT